MNHQPAIEAAFDVMRRHIDALNARDEQAIAATLHFPHFRMSGTELKVWETPDSYFSDFRARAGADWSTSCFEDMRVVDASSDKVHLDVQVLRYNTEGACIADFRSLWVITHQEGRWAAKFRSSFAPR